MTGRHVICRHGKSQSLKGRTVRPGTISNAEAGHEKLTPPYTVALAGSGAKLTTLDQTLRPLQSWIWCTEELTLIRVYGVALILYLIIVGMVLSQTIIFMV